MRIGIIGAGTIGDTLARRITGLGHQVAIASSRGPETLTELARETGATRVVSEASAGARAALEQAQPGRQPQFSGSVQSRGSFTDPR